MTKDLENWNWNILEVPMSWTSYRISIHNKKICINYSNHMQTLNKSDRLYAWAWLLLLSRIEKCSKSLKKNVITGILNRFSLSETFGIFFPNLFWPTVRKKNSRDREKLLKFETEGREFAIFLRWLEQFIQTVKGQNNFW